MQDYPERIDSKYRFVLLAANRAEQLIRGASPKEREEADASKLTRVAMMEVAEDRVAWDYGPAEEPVEEVAVETETEETAGEDT
jgi:DNA-directed RNA polymerase omega subunit